MNKIYCKFNMCFFNNKMEEKQLNKQSLENSLCLKEKIVFDLLASINEEFTEVTKLRTARDKLSVEEGGMSSSKIPFLEVAT